MKNIVMLVSGGGTNLQALIDAQKNGQNSQRQDHLRDLIQSGCVCANQS